MNERDGVRIYRDNILIDGVLYFCLRCVYAERGQRCDVKGKRVWCRTCHEWIEGVKVQ